MKTSNIEIIPSDINHSPIVNNDDFNEIDESSEKLLDNYKHTDINDLVNNSNIIIENKQLANKLYINDSSVKENTNNLISTSVINVESNIDNTLCKSTNYEIPREHGIGIPYEFNKSEKFVEYKSRYD
tara:strand:- start:14050 stop:14433 length:384 start_codon:yes stop_codon:yes gene_type:complete